MTTVEGPAAGETLRFPRIATPSVPVAKKPRTDRPGAMTPPSLNQIAVLDWLRRWPGLRLREKGRWTATWNSEASRLQMLRTAVHLQGYAPAEALDGKEGWGSFDYTPRCGTSTLNALIARGLVDPEAVGRYLHYRLSDAGRAALLRFCFLLAAFVPVRSSERTKRPVKPSAGLLKRYGGRAAAESHMKFHQQQAAYHARIADRLRASLELYEGSEEQRRDEWKARAKR